MSDQTTIERPKFFYYSVPKQPEEMNEDELVQEIHSCYHAAKRARECECGISTKETVHKRLCEFALVKLPKGIDRWNEEFATLAQELNS